LSIPEHEFMGGGAQLQEFDRHAFLFVVQGSEDGAVLFASQTQAPTATIHD